MSLNSIIDFALEGPIPGIDCKSLSVAVLILTCLSTDELLLAEPVVALVEAVVPDDAPLGPAAWSPFFGITMSF